MLLPARNKVLGRIKQGGGLDSALGPCVCHLGSKPFYSSLPLDPLLPHPFPSASFIKEEPRLGPQVVRTSL